MSDAPGRVPVLPVDTLDGAGAGAADDRPGPRRAAGGDRPRQAGRRVGGGSADPSDEIAERAARSAPESPRTAMAKRRLDADPSDSYWFGGALSDGDRFGGDSSGGDSSEQHDLRRRRRRRRLRKVLLAANVAAALLVVLIGGAWFYVLWRFNQIDHVPLPKGILDRPNTLASAAPPEIVVAPLPPADGSLAPAEGTDPKLQVDTTGVAALGGEDGENFLVIGVDDRSAVDASDCKLFGCDSVSGSRSDTLMIMRVAAKQNAVNVLSLPRDLYVHIAGTTHWDKINAAYTDSPATLIRTIQTNFGLPVHHVLEVNFRGFQKIVGVVNGVEICFPAATRDTVTGLDQPAGCHILDPRQAIAFVRSRKLETRAPDGSWRRDPQGDLGRILRQQDFIRATLKRAVDKGARNPLTLNSLLASASDAVRIDDSLGLSDIVDLAMELRGFEPDALRGFTIPATEAGGGERTVRRIDPVAARAIVGRFGRR